MLFCYKGQEYPAIVEFAPFQKVAKKRSKKRDSKIGTIEEGNKSDPPPKKHNSQVCVADQLLTWVSFF